MVVDTSRLFNYLCAVIIFILAIQWRVAYCNQWESYFSSRIYDPPEQFVVAGLKKIATSGKGKVAIDLGSGIGHETKLLLDKGFKVVAVDSNPLALQYMKHLPGIAKHNTQLKTIPSKFENLNFSSLPRADLIISSFALPFVSQSQFNRVWQKIKANIKPGGYIIINLFDPHYSFYNNKHAMTFHTKDQALNLLKGFKIIEFREVKNNIQAGAKSLYYVIVAQKK